MRWRYVPYYMHYRWFPNRMVKFILSPTNKHIQRLIWYNGYRPTNNNPGGVLFAIILIWFEHGTGHPSYRPFSREWWAESTHRENNPPSMEDIDNPSCYMSDSSRQNIISFEGLEFGTCKFSWSGGKIPHKGRYGGLVWNNFGVYGSWCISSIPA